MRFTCPDSLSPFGADGLNPYAYCAGDPVNHADPTGHHSFWGWLGIAAGVALGVLLTPVSGGSSLAVALSVVSVTTAVASTGLAVAQQFVEESDPKTAAALGWAALGTGIVSGLSSGVLSKVAPEAKSLVSLLKGTSNRPFGGLMMDGGQTPRAEPVSSTLSQNTASLGELSNETIQHIMGYLDGGDLQSLASTSSRMRANALAVSPPLGIARPVMVAPGVPFTADTIFDASFILNPEGINISRQQIRWLQRVIMGEERGVMPMRVLHDELPTTVSERAREAGYTAEQISICRFPIDNLRRYMMAHFYTSQMEVYGGVYIGNDAEMDARYAAFLNSKGYPLHY